MKFGLLGHTLGHSYSPRIHHMLGNESYTLFEKEPHELDAFFADPDLQGLNVTIPYKRDALKACHHVSEIAKRIGAVNTMIRKNSQWYGDNTDYQGFLYTLQYANIHVKDKQCLILGDGASSHTIHIALDDLGSSEVIHISRKTAPFYKDIEQFYDTADIIINTTPVGMFPTCPDSLVDISNFKHLSGVVDLIYNPLRTNLLLQAEQMHVPCVNGLPFLVAQAVASAKEFMGASFQDMSCEDIITSIRGEIENIILVGMPGVGKTTVGLELVQETGRNFFDIDQALAKEIGTVSTFIETHGEKAFSQAETAMIERYGKQTGLVISTGGGAVTMTENFAPLRQNGRIFQITQPVDQLATSGRPLSSGGLERLKELERVRTPMYRAFAQCIIDHHRNAPVTAGRILEDFQKHLKQ